MRALRSPWRRCLESDDGCQLPSHLARFRSDTSACMGQGTKPVVAIAEQRPPVFCCKLCAASMSTVSPTVGHFAMPMKKNKEQVEWHVVYTYNILKIFISTWFVVQNCLHLRVSFILFISFMLFPLLIAKPHTPLICSFAHFNFNPDCKGSYNGSASMWQIPKTWKMPPLSPNEKICRPLHLSLQLHNAKRILLVPAAIKDARVGGYITKQGGGAQSCPATQTVAHHLHCRGRLCFSWGIRCRLRRDGATARKVRARASSSTSLGTLISPFHCSLRKQCRPLKWPHQARRSVPIRRQHHAQFVKQSTLKTSK